ncbi:MAG: hypothetical protein ACI8P0_000430 [Planctomycetaceae bacterium]|jgi:hypothetical protein
MLAEYADVTNWGDFDAPLTSLFVRNPACRAQPARHARRGARDNAPIECDISEQIMG